MTKKKDCFIHHTTRMEWYVRFDDDIEQTGPFTSKENALHHIGLKRKKAVLFAIERPVDIDSLVEEIVNNICNKINSYPGIEIFKNPSRTKKAYISEDKINQHFKRLSSQVSQMLQKEKNHD